jgi:hypothetical protein
MATINNIYQYRNSAVGIIDTLATDYSAVNMDLEEVQSKLADPNVLSLLKDIVPLMNA